MRTVLVFVNGTRTSAPGIRAQGLFSRCGAPYDVHFTYRSDRGKLRCIWPMLLAAMRLRPHIVYVVDCKYTGVIAAVIAKLLLNIPYVMDTGDACYELAKATRTPLAARLVGVLEHVGYLRASAVVVRGRFHKALLSSRRVGRRVEHVPDGVDTAAVQAARSTSRACLDEKNSLVVGLVGSLNWSSNSNYCYGLELIDSLTLIADERVTGIIVGDGSGLEVLRRRAWAKGVAHRITFTGHVPYENLPEHLFAMDVCLLPQSDDIVGWVRTTGKLPLYLACNRYVLASDVGEASWILRELDPNMLHRPFPLGSRQYAEEIASRLRMLLRTPSLWEKAQYGSTIARGYFEYAMLSRRVCNLLDALAAKEAA